MTNSAELIGYGRSSKVEGMYLLAIIIFVVWLLGFAALEISSAPFHMLLIAALILFMVSMTRGKRSI